MSCEEKEPPGFTVRDSLGIQVAANRFSGRGQDQITEVASNPLLVIGREGDPDYEFYGISGVHLLSDGRLVVANSGTQEIRYYSDAGAHLRTVGGRGDGPGEFRVVSEIFGLGGDSVAVFDSRLNRVSFYNSDGLLNGTGLVPSPPNPERGVWVLSPASVAGVSQTGDLLVFGPVYIRLQGSPGLRRAQGRLSWYDPSGDLLSDLGTLPAMDFFELGEPGPLPARPAPFARRLSIAVGKENVLISQGDSFEILEFTPEGDLVRLIRETRACKAVTPADTDQRGDADAGGTSPGKVQMPYPECLPAFSDTFLDAEGKVWAREFSPPTEGDEVWRVFTGEGRAVARFRFPDGFRLFDITNGLAAGVETDQTGIEHVSVYVLPLTEPG